MIDVEKVRAAKRRWWHNSGEAHRRRQRRAAERPIYPRVASCPACGADVVKTHPHSFAWCPPCAAVLLANARSYIGRDPATGHFTNARQESAS